MPGSPETAPSPNDYRLRVRSMIGIASVLLALMGACSAVAESTAVVSAVGTPSSSGSLSSHRANRNDPLRRRARAAAAIDVAAEVIDDDLGAQAGKQKCVLAAEAGTGAGDDGDAVLEVDVHEGTKVFVQC